MQKINKNNSGFSALEPLLILVIIAIIGFVGWYVVHAQNNAQKTLDSAQNSVKPAQAYEGWKTYTNSTYGVSYKYPSNWAVSDATVPDLTGNAPNKEFTTGLKLAAASDNAVNFEVVSSDYTTASAWIDIYYGRSSTDNVVKTPGTFKGKPGAMYQITSGSDKIVFYTFDMGSKTYIFSSANGTENTQLASNYWVTFGKVYDSLRLN